MKKTQKTDILTILNNILLDALKSKEAYKSKYQEFLTTFINNYNTSLNCNSKPLFDFFKKLDNVEKLKVKLWLIKNTSLDGAEVTKNGLKLRFKEGEEVFRIFNDSLNWYDMKVEVKEPVYDDIHLKKSLTNLLKHYEKQAIKDILNTL